MKLRLLRLLGAIISGLGMALTLPPFDFGGLVWVVLLPLLVVLWSVKGKRPGWKGFGIGWIGGVAYFLLSLHWLSVVSGVGWVALSMYLALFVGLWGAFAAKWANPWAVVEVPAGETSLERKLREKSQMKSSHWKVSAASIRVAFALAALWASLEWLRGWLFTGFGWNPLATAFHDTPVMAQSADLLGLCALSFVPVFLQAVMVQTGRRLWTEAREGKIRPHADFATAALLIALCFCYGVWRLHTTGKGESVRLKALLVQLNIPQDAAQRLWSPEKIHMAYEEDTLAALQEIERQDEERFREAAERGEEIELRRPDWIMWPESSLTGRVIRTDDGTWGMWDENMLTLNRVRESGDFTVVMGLNEIEGEYFGDDLVMKERARVWNSMVVLPPDGGLTTYRKHHLVIFGEYIPLVEKLPFLKKLYEQQAGVEFGGSFSMGESFDPLPTMIDGEEIELLPTVCFEDTVPRLMRRFVRTGPQLIVNVTNDGWFKESPAAAQHFANAKFRSIELRRPMIRCANSGVSAAVNSVGTTGHPDTGVKQEIRDDAGDHLTRGWMLAEVDIPKRSPVTGYAIAGDWGVIGLGVLGLVVGVTGRRRC
ncbi:apolipoprotein N-acyltransferase [Haloferula chungangensis]|uniref:Apolipoprotein N-acyltransferase n=1 Tax=Haloferula chungangensis TaxID=1048331 RepID=A0ABW2L5M7_9BACT